MSKALDTDFTKYVVNPWAFINAPLNAIAKIEREDKPMNKSLRERMYEEKAELEEKIVKIKQFRESEAFEYLSLEDRDLLIAQENAMVTYHEILNIRYRKLKGEYK